MEPTTPSAATPAPPSPAPAPVMDVVPRHAPAPPAEHSSGQMAVKPAPPAEEAGPESKTPPDTATPKDPLPAPKNKTKQPLATKQPKNGVGMAIAATVIIVLGLAALATYAFLKTQN